MTESDQVSKSSNLANNQQDEKSEINENTTHESKEGYRTYMIGTRILSRNYTTDDIINYDSDPFANDITVSHKNTAIIIALDINSKAITVKNIDTAKILSYQLNNIAIELEEHDSDNDHIDGLATIQHQSKHNKTCTETAIPGIMQRHDTQMIRHTALAMQKEKDDTNNSEKRKQERKHEESYDKLVQSIDDDSAPRIAHNELAYRPYEYISTAVTRPNLKAHPNGKSILFTPYITDISNADDINNQHQFNYFRYWIGRYSTFRDNAQLISDDFASVVLRDEYDLENIREDMLIENSSDDSVESMILNEAEFEKYGWNHLNQTQIRLICCQVIDILPFYMEWIEELTTYKSVDDLIPTMQTQCGTLPCPALKRLLIVSKFYKQWIAQNFDQQLQPKNKFHFSVHDFMDCLEHYNSVEFQNDYQHLQHCHIEPINAATKVHHGDAFGLNVGTVQNPYNEDEEDEEEDSEDDEDEDSEEAEEKAVIDKKKEAYKVILDVENRNIYEWFEDFVGECDAESCAIFERTYRSRYDSGFEQESDRYYVLNEKEKNDWLERVAEIQYQRIFDGMHTILFHSSARFDCMGLGNSEEHRKFVMLSTEKRKTIKANSKNTQIQRAFTMPVTH